jgi:peptidoglycan-associated lipoprotein
MRKQINGVLVIAMMMIAGCSSNESVAPSGGTATNEPTPPPASTSIKTGYGFDQWQQGPLGDVFFEFDSADLSSDAEQQLKDNADWLKGNSPKSVMIEGHCDERGTSEYNLALGDRRAKSAKEFLTRLGIGASRLETISYGEERPFALDHNDEAWAKNRRDHFVVK